MKVYSICLLMFVIIIAICFIIKAVKLSMGLNMKCNKMDKDKCGLCDDTKNCVYNTKVTCKNQQNESLKFFNTHAISYYNNLACNIYSNIMVAEGLCRNNNTNTNCTGYSEDCIPFMLDSIENILIKLEKTNVRN